MSDTSVQVQNLNLQKNQALQFAADLLNVVAEKDLFWGGWEVEDVSKVLDVYLPQLAPGAVTLEEAQSQAVQSKLMLDKILQTWSGARACVELGKCGVAKYFAECSIDTIPMGGNQFTHEGEVVRIETGICRNPMSGAKF